MKKFCYTVKDPEGVHALPAGGMAALARKYSSVITAEGNGQTADARHVFGIMSLGVKNGGLITIICEGEDEEEAAKALLKYARDNF
ncbi:MAG: HPr family phosphocarrier protein [Butyrivibrio sp.]|nr:HPr family phosphocarrier protein [Butyrivibrio sp.]